MSNWTRIDSEQGFQEYLCNFKQFFGHSLRHHFTPNEYPCMTAYHMVADRDDEDCCYHFFVYQKKLIDVVNDTSVQAFLVEEGDDF